MRAVIFQLMLATAVPVGLLGGLAEAQQSNNCKLPGGICQSSNFQALAGSCITFEPGGAELCPLPDGGFPFSGGGGGGCFPYLDGGGVCDEFGIPGGVGLSGSSVFGPSGGDVSLQNIGGIIVFPGRRGPEQSNPVCGSTRRPNVRAWRLWRVRTGL